MKKFLMIGSVMALCSSVSAYASDKKPTPETKVNSHYIVAVNSIPKSVRPYILFGMKNLTKSEMNSFVSEASTSYGLGNLIEKRSFAGVFNDVPNKHILFGSLSKSEGDMDYKVDTESGIRYTFRKNEINISAPYKNGYCSYNLKKTKEKIQATNGYILKDVPDCFKGSKSFPYAIYITADKE